MSSAITGVASPYQVRAEATSEIFAYARSVFFNDYPLVTRLGRLPAGTNKFDMISRNARATTLVLGAAVANNTTTSLTLTTGGGATLMPGDVLELDSGERVEVQSKSGDALTVVRGAEGTTAAAQNNSTSATLLYNSRTGAEVDQDGVRTARTIITQYLHTFQHPVQIGGRANALRNLVIPERPTLVSQQELEATEELFRDAERAMLYGLGQDAAASTDRWKMVGLRSISGTVGTRTTSPTNTSTYTAADFIRDTAEKLASKGGRGDTLLVSYDFMSGIAVWTDSVLQVNAGTNVFGAPIELFEAPLLFPGMRFIVDRSLKSKSAVLLDSGKVRIRYLRDLFVKPRGSRGDAVESDVIADYAIEVEDPERSVAWVEGITTFANSNS